MQTSTQNQQAGLDMENQLTLTRYIREYLTDPTKGAELIPTNTGIGNMDIETQISKYNDMLLKRNKLVTNSSKNNPVVMDLNNYLSGKVDEIESIVRDSGLHPNLDVICNGSIPPNPAELLLNKRLDKMVDELRKCYDYVLLDNVPSNMIADAVIVSRVVDLTIYVIRAGSIDRRQLPEVEKLYRQKKFKNMAILLNGVKYKHSRYGYYKYG